MIGLPTDVADLEGEGFADGEVPVWDTAAAMFLPGASSGLADTYVRVVEHGSDPDVARPTTDGPVLWIGTVNPNNDEVGDLILRTDEDALATTAAAVTFDPTGLAIVTADDVQEAIEELDAALDALDPGGSGGLMVVDPGTVTYDDTDPDVIGITLETVWGIDGVDPYYDNAGAAAGDEAALCWDPVLAVYTLVPYHP